VRSIIVINRLKQSMPAGGAAASRPSASLGFRAA
jgi:hypothetical protein